MRKTFYAFAFFSIVTLSFTACKKGDTGPQGEQGNPGPTGPKGDAGSANVIYSNWLDVTFQLVDVDGDNVPDAYGANITAQKLTADILNKGDVKVFWNAGVPNDPYVVPLPFADLTLSAFYTQTIELTSTNNYSTTTTAQGKQNQYRYVLIPGGVGARSAINWNDYNQVKAYLNLKD
ncbi:MAG: collagen-like protein [Chitinophagaceae bacterium]